MASEASMIQIQRHRVYGRRDSRSFTSGGRNQLSLQEQQHPGMALLTRLAGALASQRPIAYNINLARVAEDVKAGLFLSQLLYWTKVGVDVDQQQGWVFKTREQWQLETALSRCEQESARKRLLKLGLIEETRWGVPPRMAFRVRPSELGTRVSSMLRCQPVQLTLLDIRASENKVRALLGRSLAFYRIYVDILGSVPSAIFLSKAVQVQRNVIEAQIVRERGSSGAPQAWEHNWFSLTTDQWEIETGLRAGQVRRAKQDLCQIGGLEEATLTWPKRKLYQRIHVEQLTATVTKFMTVAALNGTATSVLCSNEDGGVKVSTGSQGLPSDSRGISSQYLRTSAGKQQRPDPEVAPGSPVCPTDSRGISSPTWRTHEIQQALSTTRKNFPTDSLGISRKKFPTLPLDRLKGQLPPNSVPVKRSVSAPQRSISASLRQVSALPAVGLNNSSGRFLHFKRQVSAPLHAGAEEGLQSQTTTTTTASAGTSDPALPTTTNSVVVVVQPQSANPQSPVKRAPTSLFDGGRGMAAAGALRNRFPGKVRQSVDLPLETPPCSSPSEPQHGAEPVSADLLWPSMLSAGGEFAAAQQPCRQLLAGVPGGRQQELLDELAARLRAGGVLRPVPYLRRLVDADRQAGWALVLEVAHEEVELRQRLELRRNRQVAQAADQGSSGSSDAQVQPAEKASVSGTSPEALAARERLKELRQMYRSEMGSSKNQINKSSEDVCTQNLQSCASIEKTTTNQKSKAPRQGSAHD